MRDGGGGYGERVTDKVPKEIEEHFRERERAMTSAAGSSSRGWLAVCVDERGNLDVYGDRYGLHFLAAFVRSDGGSRRTLRLDEPGSLCAEASALRHLQVVPTADAVCIKARGEALEISGSAELRAILAYTLAFLGESDPDQAIRPHDHIEYWPEHDYLHSASKPVCVYLHERP